MCTYIPESTKYINFHKTQCNLEISKMQILNMKFNTIFT